MSVFHKSGDFTRAALLIGSALVAIAAIAAVALVVSSLLSSPAEPPAPAQGLAVAPLPQVALLPPTAGPAVAAAEAPRSDPDAWPADPEDRIRATQRLLGELKLLGDAPTGQPGPVTAAAIRDYQRMAGLEETGEVSEALFVSLKEVAALVFAAPARTPD